MSISTLPVNHSYIILKLLPLIIVIKLDKGFSHIIRVNSLEESFEIAEYSFVLVKNSKACVCSKLLPNKFTVVALPVIFSKVKNFLHSFIRKKYL